ncbi:Phosphatidylinositol glycan anchor biosynthesis class U protein [Halotydeus destructor]|nr:Phosphatidylinositol glycan anchor biosynthesis class U protein [Halotydeus destructor]
MNTVEGLISIGTAAVIGSLLRLFLMSSSYQVDIANRVEISTPVNAWKRATEGVYLLNNSISPYSGDTFHGDPLSLHFYKYLVENVGTSSPYIFITADVLTAICLAFSSYFVVRNIASREEHKISVLQESDREVLGIDAGKAVEVSVKVATIYLLSPYSILSCTAQATSIFSNLLVSVVLLSATVGGRLTACSLVALLTIRDLYPVVLLVPVLLIIEHRNHSSSETEIEFKTRFWFSSIVTIMLFITSFSVIIGLSANFNGDKWDFVDSTFGFLLTVPDLTPNIGVYWYFFTEMFDHFRSFFLWTFQINAFIFAIPLGIALRKTPYFLFYVLLILVSLVKPYPSISDFTLYLALLPVWSHLTTFTKQGLVIGSVFVTTSILAPIMWHMWIMTGTANSNFYFAVTLAYNVAQIFLATDLLFANLKRQFFIENGIKIDPKTGFPEKLELVQ